MKCRGKRDNTWNITRSSSFSPLHFMLYGGNTWDSYKANGCGSGFAFRHTMSYWKECPAARSNAGIMFFFSSLLNFLQLITTIPLRTFFSLWDLLYNIVRLLSGEDIHIIQYIYRCSALVEVSCTVNRVFIEADCALIYRRTVNINVRLLLWRRIIYIHTQLNYPRVPGTGRNETNSKHNSLITYT